MQEWFNKILALSTIVTYPDDSMTHASPHVHTWIECRQNVWNGQRLELEGTEGGNNGEMKDKKKSKK